MGIWLDTRFQMKPEKMLEEMGFLEEEKEEGEVLAWKRVLKHNKLPFLAKLYEGRRVDIYEETTGRNTLMLMSVGRICIEENIEDILPFIDFVKLYLPQKGKIEINGKKEHISESLLKDIARILEIEILGIETAYFGSGHTGEVASIKYESTTKDDWDQSISKS